MSDKPDRERILDKIRKCLALSKSANEYEAATALRQAQKLMAMHDLSHEDVDLVEYISAVVVTDYEWPKGRVKLSVSKDGKLSIDRSQVLPRIITAVVALVGHSMGVQSVAEAHNKGQTTFIAIRYFGTRARVVTALHVHEVVYRAVGRAWTQYAENAQELRGRPGARAGFYLGWCSNVASKVEALAVSKEDQEKTLRKRNAHYEKTGVADAQKNTRGLYQETIAAGAEAGEEFRIHRPVEQSKMKIGFDK